MKAKKARNHILLVEDQAIIALDEARKIESFGYRVSIANTGEEAEKMILTGEDVHLVLMDIDLGSGIDGTETARRILQKKEIPIVFLTSHAEKEYVEKVKQITRYGYVLKNSGDFVLQSSIEMAFQLFDAYKTAKKHEQESRKNQAFLEKIFEILPIGLWIADKNGKLQRGNPAGVEIWGAEPKVGQEEYKLFKARRYPSLEELKPEDWALAHSINEGVTVRDELLEIDAFDGKKKIILNYTAPVFDENNAIQGAVIINQDITSRKLFEDYLIESEHKYRLIFNNAPLGLLRFDNNGVITECNDVFVGIIGSTREKLIGLNMLNLPDTRVTASIQQMFEEKKTTSIEITYSSVTADKVTPIRIICAPVILDEGDLNGGVMIIEDITERKETEDRLRQSEERYRRILDEIEDGYYEVDLAGNLTLFNDAVPRILEYKPENLFDINYREYTDRENYKQIYEKFNETFRTGKAARGFSWEVITSEGRKKFIEVSVSLITDKHGNPAGFRGIARDVTERIEAEKEIRLLLSEKEKLLNELQHRVKNSMQMMSSLVNLEYGRSKSGETKSVLETLRGQIQSMTNLYTLLYNTSSVTMVNLNQYLSSIIDFIKNSYGTDSSKIIFRENYDSIKFKARDAAPLGLILNELVTNSLKHAFTEEESGIVDISLVKENDTILLSVSDNGLSLPGNFDPHSSPGTGMQLVSMLSKQLHGTFTVLQDEKKLFVVTIPLDQPQ